LSRDNSFNQSDDKSDREEAFGPSIAKPMSKFGQLPPIAPMTLQPALAMQLKSATARPATGIRAKRAAQINRSLRKGRSNGPRKVTHA
jgi:hypothetical protein